MKKSFVLLCILFITSCTLFKKTPQPKREFRGVWIATVVNIDWPKNGNDSAEKQKADYLDILDFYHNENYNAVIVQIRAAGDAFYNSEYAPWSRFLTGEEGTAPEWNTDVLEWMISETHKRGMEFHAWLNPYRATFDEDFELLSETHDYCTHPEWMVHYGTKNYYNPGLPEVRNQFSKIIVEIVSRYDIDAIHFDDYFYPYKIKDEVFNDSVAFATYGGNFKNLEDWRRSNVDSLVKQVHDSVKSKKPWVQFGVSPFGVWKNSTTDPKGSDTKAGQTTYEDLYADPLLWMQQGWLDYIAPQAYWSMDLPAASHKTILNWWADNTVNTNLYMGNGPYKIRNNSDKAWKKRKELPDQVALARKTPAVTGNIFFSAKSLMNGMDDVNRTLRRKLYKGKALTPISPLVSGFENIHNPYVSYEIEDDTILLYFSTLTNYRYVLVYEAGKDAISNYPISRLISKHFVGGNNKVGFPNRLIKGKKQIAIAVIDKFGRESFPITLNLKTTHGTER